MKVYFVIFNTPAPHIFLFLMVIALGIFRKRYFGEAPIDWNIGIPWIIMTYGGYHFIGHIFEYQSNLFIWLLPTFLPLTYLVHYLAKLKKEAAEQEWHDPESIDRDRQEKISSVVKATGCSREKAETLLDSHGGDDVRAVMAIKAEKIAPAAAESPSSPSASLPENDDGGAGAHKAMILCPQCNRSNPADRQICIYCNARLVAKIPCIDCGRMNPPQKIVCQYCGGKIGAP